MNKSDKNQIICEYWETPVVDHQFLWLSQQLYTEMNNYFFFENDVDGPTDPIYVMCIRTRETFKISDETESANRIFELTKNKNETSGRKRGLTFKVWNTPFAIEVCSGLKISSEEYDQMEKFQYIVSTQDETIEFVTFSPPTWETYEGIKLEDLVIQYVKKDSLD